eukprot:gb/GECG01011775.1/.p1 GENE.gb/GECG01011775.1/~~gb/GECG01011775.1/.p1  ORF type:complete len:101 (+),score=8.02 gb/GECG01011775.1/:1-303(+)
MEHVQMVLAFRISTGRSKKGKDLYQGVSTQHHGPGGDNRRGLAEKCTSGCLPCSIDATDSNCSDDNTIPHILGQMVIKETFTMYNDVTCVSCIVLHFGYW